MWDNTHLSFPTLEQVNEKIITFQSIIKKKELQNDPAMLSEIKILIERSFSLFQVNEGLI